jgi:hypothetical protein
VLVVGGGVGKAVLVVGVGVGKAVLVVGAGVGKEALVFWWRALRAFSNTNNRHQHQPFDILPSYPTTTPRQP